MTIARSQDPFFKAAVFRPRNELLFDFLFFGVVRIEKKDREILVGEGLFEGIDFAERMEKPGCDERLLKRLERDRSQIFAPLIDSPD